MNSDPDKNETDRPEPRRSELNKFVQELIDQQESELDAARVLAERPEIQDYRSLIVDLAYEDFCRRRERGQQVEAGEFCRQFGSAEESLIAVLDFDDAIRADPEVLSADPEIAWPVCGEKFCEYDLVELLGSGGASRVFLARQHRAGGRQVVLKICRHVSSEANLLGKLKSRGIGEVHTVARDPESGYSAICMPFISRVTLNDLAEEVRKESSVPRAFGGRLQQIVAEYHLNDSLTEAKPLVFPSESTVSMITKDHSLPDILCRWGMQMCASLGDAHSDGTLHCDVKPANLLVLPDLSLRLLDFNLAVKEGKFAGQGGTVQFMPTEQLFKVRESLIERGHLKRNDDWNDPPFIQQDVSPASDVFGICATLWFCATGQPPYGFSKELNQAAQVPAMLSRHLQGITSKALGQAKAVVPDRLVKVMLKGLSPDPTNRYSDTISLLDALTSVATVPQNRRSFIRLGAYLAGTCALGAAAYFGPIRIGQKGPDRDEIELDIRDEIKNRDFEMAISLGRQCPEDDRIQFLVTAAQTLLVVRPAPRRAWNLSTYRQLRDSWLAQTQRPTWQKEAFYNLALIELEIEEFEEAFDSYQNARTRGLTPDPTMNLLCEYQSIEDSREAVDVALSHLKSLPFDGTNGQYRCLTRSALSHIEKLQNQGADLEHLKESVQCLVDLQFDKRTPLALPVSQVLFFPRKLGMENPSSGMTQPDSTKNAYRNLHDRIRIPSMEP